MLGRKCILIIIYSILSHFGNKIWDKYSSLQALYTSGLALFNDDRFNWTLSNDFGLLEERGYRLKHLPYEQNNLCLE